MRIYTRRGDGGSTDLRVGGRVEKTSVAIEVNGAVDEAQAALGCARAEAEPGGELDGELIGLERDLWILMAEVATHPDRRDELVPGATAVTTAMIDALEATIDRHMAELDPARGFAVPGGSRCSAALDLARTVVRRAERNALRLDLPADCLVVPYLNRLSDLCWVLARTAEETHLRAPDASPLAAASPPPPTPFLGERAGQE